MLTNFLTEQMKSLWFLLFLLPVAICASERNLQIEQTVSHFVEMECARGSHVAFGEIVTHSEESEKFQDGLFYNSEASRMVRSSCSNVSSWILVREDQRFAKGPTKRPLLHIVLLEDFDIDMLVSVWPLVITGGSIISSIGVDRAAIATFQHKNPLSVQVTNIVDENGKGTSVVVFKVIAELQRRETMVPAQSPQSNILIEVVSPQAGETYFHSFADGEVSTNIRVEITNATSYWRDALRER
jgi:hypothetical protein